MNPMPSIPMLSGSGGSGKVLMVIGVLAVLFMVANKEKQPVATSAPKQ